MVTEEGIYSCYMLVYDRNGYSIDIALSSVEILREGHSDEMTQIKLELAGTK